MKLNTVNVIEFVDDTISSVRSFSDDAQGNAEAEQLFRQIANEQEKSDDEPLFSEEDIEAGIDDGSLDDENRGWAVYLVHSS
jgi:hypothetical protein